ncbi:MAG: signal recognition particle protein Srp19, partial [Candidatus Parvarchaeota archaeon]|nr:signal recognition particle protein Srp19 [Candidatus Haiyanarchaeum thermophilum]
CKHTNAKVKFIGTGEHLDEIEEFEPKKFVARLLGIGDLETLMRKVEETVEKERLEHVARKAIKGGMNLKDLYDQIQAMQKVGPLNKLISFIPGLSLVKLPKEALPMQEEKLKKFAYIIQSMTPEERENPKIINASRIRRIARGAGVKEEDVRELLSFYNQMNKLMKMFGSQDVSKLLKRLGGTKL